MRTQVQSLASLSGLRICHCRKLWCRSKTQPGSDVAVAMVQARGYSSDSTSRLGTSICQGRGSPKKRTHIHTHKDKILFFLLFIFAFFFFPQPCPQHMEVPRLVVKSELQVPAYTRAKAMPKPDHVCDPHRSLRQRRILNPRSGARGRTCILMDTSCLRSH